MMMRLATCEEEMKARIQTTATRKANAKERKKMNDVVEINEAALWDKDLGNGNGRRKLLFPVVNGARMDVIILSQC